MNKLSRPISYIMLYTNDTREKTDIVKSLNKGSVWMPIAISLWVCLRIVYLIFQWIITMFPIKTAVCGYPLFSDKPLRVPKTHREKWENALEQIPRD